METNKRMTPKYDDGKYGEETRCWTRNRLTARETDPTPSFQPLEAAQRAQVNLRIAELEREVQELRAELRLVRTAMLGHPVMHQRQAIVDPKIASVIQITEALFSGSTIEIEMDADPSEPDDYFVVIKVDCPGELKDILVKESEWNRRVRECDSGYSGQLRLLVCPVE